ncbi:ABC transporter substrate-binding protein [Pelagovum pacificum]|uniref:Sugar ABC transporter substrate-binding protein n=1 Tax=Pelagovum pacificum TaxID=2588711 RepID=A0A5C5GB14_9RHOB|nr:sugar ABC transporter substrate-binding protein [Pelagovum pacificum]QQA41791.1 sugar ABC transporter substrate-binding protein [Pelagovum pacificum]TNY30767.1 sugar ABC transporter substrate-binding protein [Pelagovum pacificum]
MFKYKALTVLAGVTAATPAFAEEVDIWVRTSTAPILEAMAESYNASHEDQISIVPVVAEQMVPKLGAALAGGAAPSAVAMDLIYMPTFAAAGMLEDMTDFIDSLPYSDALSPSHVRLATYEGKKYGVPLTPDASVIVYNTDLLDAAGVDPSALESLESLAEAAVSISELDDETYGFMFVGNSGSWMAYDFLPHIWAGGDDILSEDGRSQTVDTPSMRATLQLYNDMWEAGAIHPTTRSGNGNSAVEAFASGQVGILMSGSYIVNLMTANYPDVNFGIAPIPGPTGGTATFAGGDDVVMIEGISDEKRALVEDFIEYYMQPEQQVTITELAGMPSRTDLAEEAYADFDERNLIAYDMLQSGFTPYTYANDALFISLTGPWLELLETAIFDGDVDGAIEMAEGRFEQILERTNP